MSTTEFDGLLGFFNEEGKPPLDLSTFKGAIRGLVAPQLQKSVVPIDMGCGDVAIACTREFAGSSNYLALINTIRGPRFLLSVVKEAVVSDAQVQQIWNFSDKRVLPKTASPIVNEENKYIVIYDDIVTRACELNASDIHFEISNGDTSKIRLRIFGRLKDWKSMSSEIIKGCLSAAYSKRTKSGTNSSGSLSFERAMNTITQQVVNGKTINGRFNGYPLVNGYDVVMRLLDSDPKTAIPSIESLGYSKYHVEEQILPAIRRNAGMMAISGSTGSGKSTALRSFIFQIPDRDQLKIFGVEDPVEYINPFMRQISVQRSSDDPDDVVKMKFLSALRSVLRMDPDALMLGEIRDAESASLASEFNRTGHRVFTTVHGDGCVDVLARMASEEIGIPPSTLAAKKYLSAVMYQKLLPKLCPHCKLPAIDHLSLETQTILREKFHVNPMTMFVANKEGCPHCKVAELGLAGTKGLTVVAEILTPTDEIQTAIKGRQWAQVEALWRSLRTEGFDSPNMAGKTAFEHALFKACDGLVDPCDIEADFESFETYQVFDIEKSLAAKPKHLVGISSQVDTSHGFGFEPEHEPSQAQVAPLQAKTEELVAHV
jgi:type II secretory ATPase GspE/PulE/Tfp pilus assembly ATPase PilB-like protein